MNCLEHETGDHSPPAPTSGISSCLGHAAPVDTIRTGQPSFAFMLRLQPLVSTCRTQHSNTGVLTQQGFRF